MSRKKVVKNLISDSESSDSDESQTVMRKRLKNIESSSESDIENYLQPVNQINLDSPFFKPQVPNLQSPQKRVPFVKVYNVCPPSKSKSVQGQTSDWCFKQLQDYTKKMDEAKKHIEEYKAKKQAENKEQVTSKLSDCFDSGSDLEWQEVEEIEKIKPDLVPKENIEVIVEMSDAIKKRKQVDMDAVIKRRINRIKKEHQVLIHKVHILGWIAHGNYLNSVINSSIILAHALSLLPSQYCCSSDDLDLKSLNQLVKWYQKAVINSNENPLNHDALNQSLDAFLAKQISNQEAYGEKMLVYMFVAILRSLGIQCRLVISFQVEPLRPSKSELCSLSTKNTKPSKTVVKDENKNVKVEKIKSRMCDGKSRRKKKRAAQGKKKSDAQSQKLLEKGSKADSKTRTLRSHNKRLQDEQHLEQKKIKKISITQKTPTRSSCNVVQTKRNLRSRAKMNILQVDGANDTSSSEDEDALKPTQRKLRRLTRKKSSTTKKLEESDSGDDFVSSPRNRSEQKETYKLSLSHDSEDDSDFVPKSPSKKRRASEDFDSKIKKPRMKKTKSSSNKNVVYTWSEVFLQKEQRWVTIDVTTGQVDCVTELETRVANPVTYIVAWNNDNTLKDVTSRYCKNFNTVTRKLRVNSKWWQATLKPFQGLTTILDQKEDDELERLQLATPLPATIAEYKNHPLYVLKRHLLKYEALFPPDPPTLGFVKNEAVYSRQCVTILHPRDVWLKQAKVVKLGEKPYKIVKGRPRWDRLNRKIVTDPEMDVFGLWQTQDYEPPVAENGIVPRNEYGNVDLYRLSMLPKNTVHLKLPGLGRVAKKLNIDCAAAFVGYDYANGRVNPAFDGFVVCEENADVLVAAWELEQEEAKKKEREKIEQRVYSNWKKLIKGLLIRERLKTKYQFTSNPTSSKSSKVAIKALKKT